MYFALYFLAVAAVVVNFMYYYSTIATLECTLPCFSPNIQCRLFSITPNNNEVITYGGIIRSSMRYSYPTQQIMISNLRYNTTYEYCVVAVDTTNNNMMVGDPVCGKFYTIAGIAFVFIVVMNISSSYKNIFFYTLLFWFNCDVNNFAFNWYGHQIYLLFGCFYLCMYIVGDKTDGQVTNKFDLLKKAQA